MCTCTPGAGNRSVGTHRGVRLLVDGPTTIGTCTIEEASVFSGPPVRLHLGTVIGTVMASAPRRSADRLGVCGRVRSPQARWEPDCNSLVRAP